MISVRGDIIMDIGLVENCTGCGACKFVCPKKCITMQLDKEGFLFPKIDKDKCIKCGMCLNLCPSYKNNTIIQSENNELKIYAYINGRSNDLQKASSGGAFTLFADYVLLKNGIVFGAIFNNDFDAIMCCADNKEDVFRMCGSKYVQCDTRNTYSLVKKYLNSGQWVLYTGTSCQIAGLYATLKKVDISRLITVELLCHGVPSNHLFKKYISFLEGKYGKIVNYTFRDKTKWGWGHWGSFEYLKGGKTHKKYFPVASDYFYSLYFQENIFRESCYSCKYANITRIADFTIGDFWGNDDLFPELDPKNGISLILANNKKSIDLLENIVQERVNDVLLCTDINKVVIYNKTLIKPTVRPVSRNLIYHEFFNEDFEKVAKRHVKTRYIVPLIMRYLPRRLKLNVKRIISFLRN